VLRAEEEQGMLSWGEQEGRVSLTLDPCELWGRRGQSPRQVGGQGLQALRRGVGALSTGWVPLEVTPSLPDTPPWGSPAELGTRGRCLPASSGHFKTNAAVETVLLWLNKQAELGLHQLCTFD